MPCFPFFTSFLRRLYSKYEITVIGNGQFVYFPSIPEFILGKKTREGITVDVRHYLRRRNILFIDDMATDIHDGGRTVITTNGSYRNDALFIGIGPAFMVHDIPGTSDHTFSPVADHIACRLSCADWKVWTMP